MPLSKIRPTTSATHVTRPAPLARPQPPTVSPAPAYSITFTPPKHAKLLVPTDNSTLQDPTTVCPVMPNA